MNINFLNNIVIFTVFSIFIVFAANAVCPTPEDVYEAMKKIPAGHLKRGDFILGHQVVKTRYPRRLVTGADAHVLKQDGRTLGYYEMIDLELDSTNESDLKKICAYRADLGDVVASFIFID